MDFLSPPPPPPPPPPPSSMFHIPLHSPGNSFPVIAIALIGILATAFILVSYYIFVIKCCLTWHQIDFTNRFSPRRRNDPTNPSSNSSTDDGPKGLEEGLIRSIPIIKFRKQKEQDRTTSDQKKCTDKATDCTYECAVCLSEFEDGEKLRVIPNCCHAFHIDCIDIWLQNNANCPLCRTGISISTIANSNTNKNWIYPPRNNDDNFEGNDEDYVVIEIEGNNLDEPRVVSASTSNSTTNQMEEHAQAISEITRPKGGERKELGHVCSMGDELLDMRNKGDEFGDIQPMRRSISMDLSSHRELCLEMQGFNLKQCREIVGNNVEGDSSTSTAGSSSKVRRSIFSFGYGRRGSVQPVHLDP